MSDQTRFVKRKITSASHAGTSWRVTVAVTLRARPRLQSVILASTPVAPASVGTLFHTERTSSAGFGRCQGTSPCGARRTRDRSRRSPSRSPSAPERRCSGERAYLAERLRAVPRLRAKPSEPRGDTQSAGAAEGSPRLPAALVVVVPAGARRDRRRFAPEQGFDRAPEHAHPEERMAHGQGVEQERLDLAERQRPDVQEPLTLELSEAACRARSAGCRYRRRARTREGRRGNARWRRSHRRSTASGRTREIGTGRLGRDDRGDDRSE